MNEQFGGMTKDEAIAGIAEEAFAADRVKLGVSSTPTIFVNGRMIAGAAPFDAFARIVDEELERSAKGTPGRPATTFTK